MAMNEVVPQDAAFRLPLWSWLLTVPIFSPVILGILGLLLFYQKFYCTCVYFFQYLYNRRYQGRPLPGVLAVVGGTNGLWLFFPLIGLYVCLHLILDNRFDLIWG